MNFIATIPKRTMNSPQDHEPRATQSDSAVPQKWLVPITLLNYAVGKGYRSEAAISLWRHNAMRHSFGSYFLGRTKDENLTASEMGNSPGVVIRHYRAVVKNAEVAGYWEISPTNIGQG